MAYTQDERWLLEEKYFGEESDAFRADCVRLAQGVPLAYLIGWAPFLSTKIWLDSHPLIPRPETEYWTERAIERLNGRAAQATRPLRVLDLCAGSGCIGVAVAAAVPEAQVDFAELDPAHGETILRNLKENGCDPARTHVFTADLFDGVEVPPGGYDFILTNPPYIDPALDRTEVAVRAHEPHLALYGGKDGVELIFRIIAGAKKRLAPGGQLWLEHEPEQVDLIRALADTRGFDATTFPDQYGVKRYTVLVLQ